MKVFNRLKQRFGETPQANGLFSKVYDQIIFEGDAISFASNGKKRTINVENIDLIKIYESKAYMPFAAGGAHAFLKKRLVFVTSQGNIGINVSGEYPTYERNIELVKDLKNLFPHVLVTKKNYLPGWLRVVLIVLLIIYLNWLKSK